MSDNFLQANSFLSNRSLSRNYQHRLFCRLKPCNNLVRDVLNLCPAMLPADGTFPYDADSPALLLIESDVPRVVFPVCGKLLLPELTVRFGEDKVTAVFMRMPEAAVYEDDRIVVRKYEVRRAVIALVADAVAEARPEQGRADLLFRLRVL